MLKDDVESPIDWLKAYNKSQESVFVGIQALEDDVVVDLSQGKKDKHTSTNYSIGQGNKYIISSVENQEEGMINTTTTENCNFKTDNWCMYTGYGDWKSIERRKLLSFVLP